MQPPGLVLGTAGHIDHGKTRLVAALTGTDTDRLEEEASRGISIELGFAELVLPSGRALGVVDVPGHERFVRTMVAGAGSVDLFMLVVAADDGVMPQTEEHLEALRALGVGSGVVALSKIDLVDAETVAVAREEIRSLLPETPIVEVSAVRGDGLAKLVEAIGIVSDTVAGDSEVGGWPTSGGILHVDRSFTIAGAGTVVTGTVRGAGFTAGTSVTTLPGAASARLRSIQTHGRDTPSVGPGHRAALNLPALSPASVPRGCVVCSPDSSPASSYRLDVELRLSHPDRPLPRRVQVHHGTRDVAARIVPCGDDLAQMRLESPLVARARDRVVLRSISPTATLGGATVVDPDPPRHGPRAGTRWLQLLRSAGPAEIVSFAVADGRELSADPAEWNGDSDPAWALSRFPLRAWVDAVRSLLEAGTIEDRHGRLTIGTAPAGQPARRAVRKMDLTDVKLLTALTADGMEPRSPQTLATDLDLERRDVMDRLAAMDEAGHLRRISAEIFYPPERLEALERTAILVARESGGATLAQLRDHLRTSRKYAQALLEHLDRIGTTVRRGDQHILRSPGGPPSA